MSVSYQVEEAGFEHQSAMPDVLMPEQLPGDEVWREKLLARYPSSATRGWMALRPLEIKPTSLDSPMWAAAASRPARACGSGCAGACRTTCPPIRPCSLMLPTSPCSRRRCCRTARACSIPICRWRALDHALWFHRRFRADEWLLYVQESPAAFGARGFCRGEFFTRDGLLVASVTQEGLIRPVESK